MGHLGIGPCSLSAGSPDIQLRPGNHLTLCSRLLDKLKYARGGSKEDLKLAEVGEDPGLALQIQRPHCAVGYSCELPGSLTAPSSLSFQGKDCHAAASGAWQHVRWADTLCRLAAQGYTGSCTGLSLCQMETCMLMELSMSTVLLMGWKWRPKEMPCICARRTRCSPEQPCYAMLTRPFVF